MKTETDDPAQVAPRLLTELPGPAEPGAARPRRDDAVPGPRRRSRAAGPRPKRGRTVTDVDGNVFLDLASASASVPLGAGREELIEPAVAALRRFGNEDSHALVSELDRPTSPSA